MIYIILYILSMFLAPVLGGLLDRTHDSGYPAGHIFFIILSPICCIVILFVFFVDFIDKINFKNIQPFQKIYDLVKGTKK